VRNPTQPQGSRDPRQEHLDAAGSQRLEDAGRARNQLDGERVWQLLETVADPEIPVLSVLDLGIVRYVRWVPSCEGLDRLHVGITPTYSGCPATEVIRQGIRGALDEGGFPDAVIDEVLAPAWSSDWLTESGRKKLASFGIAPPEHTVSDPRHILRAPTPVTCPRCGSRDTQRVSEFGSTPCKAHYRCIGCLEPFDYFKCL